MENVYPCTQICSFQTDFLLTYNQNQGLSLTLTKANPID